MATVTLPAAGGGTERWNHRRAAGAAVGRPSGTEPRGLRRRPCRRRSAGRGRPVAGDRGRLGPHHRLSRTPCGRSGSGVRRVDGHGPARHGARLADQPGADPPVASTPPVPAVARRSPAAAVPTTWTRPTPAASTDVIAAYDHQAEAIEAAGGRLIVMASRAIGPGRRRPRRLPPGLRARSGAGGRTGDPALAGRHVRSGAGRVLGHGGHPGGDGHLCGNPGGQRRQGRRDQDLPARQGRRDSRCGGACRRACGCIPATTSTIRS